MPGSGKSRTGPWKGSGRRWRGADGSGGRGGMFERGRKGRNVRQRTVTSGAKPVKCLANFFWHTFAESCTAAPTWQQRIGGDRRCGWRQPARSWTPRTANEPRTLKAAIWQAPGPSPPLAHYLPEHPSPTRDSDVAQHGMALGRGGGGRGGPGRRISRRHASRRCWCGVSGGVQAIWASRNWRASVAGGARRSTPVSLTCVASTPSSPSSARLTRQGRCASVQ